MTATAYERLLDTLADRVTHANGSQAYARCPAHEDNNPSLSITGIEGSVLVRCQRDCRTEDVLAALGLALRDLYDNPRGATYLYDNGRVVHRTPDKRFYQKNTDRPPELYRLSKVTAAVAAGEVVYLCEGEKDVHALEMLGVVATCNPMGAGKWAKIDPSPLHGGQVRIIADQDEPGRMHAAEVLASLAGKADAAVFSPKVGKDAADHIAAGYAVSDFIPMVLSTPSNHRATVPPDPPVLASAPRILDVLARDAVAMGVVGEQTVVATTYLVVTSRLLDKQASLAVKGHSASGKSHAVTTVLKLFPPEALMVFTAMSSLALVYSTEEYAHRTIVVYEATALREGAEDNMTAYLLRSLLSEGRLEYEVTVKGKDGAFVTKRIVKDGPTNLIITTTKVAIHGENETRMLSVTTDDSREQTGRVLAALADETERNVNVDQWRQLQHWLAGAEHRVTVPYASRLAELIPPVAVRLRRDFNTLLALIRAHAVLHQLNRERDPDGRIVASLDDYEVVRGYVADVLAEGVATTVSPTVRETVEAVTKLDRPDGVQATEIAEQLKLDKSAARRRLVAAATDGYVQNLEDKRGRPGRWRPAALLPDDVELLPSVARVRAVASPVATANHHETQQTSDTDAGGGTVARAHQGKERARCTTCGEPIDRFWTEQGITVHPGCETP